MNGIHQFVDQSCVDPADYEVFKQDHAPGPFIFPNSGLILQQNKRSIFQAALTRMSSSFIDPHGIGPNPIEDLCRAIIIPVRELPYDNAKREIEEYIDELQNGGNVELSIGEMARHLKLDLDIVIDVFEERGLLD